MIKVASDQSLLTKYGSLRKHNKKRRIKKEMKEDGIQRISKQI